MNENFWINYNKIFSYNAFLNFIVTERGFGKTYGISKYVVNDFLNNKNEFAYIRRYKSELKKSVPKFFSGLIKNNEFPDHHLLSKGYSFYIDDQEAGYSMTLSTAQDLKGTNYSNVKTIIFDEFIIEEGQKKFYLTNEVFVFLNLIETIARLRDDVKIFMLGNSGNLYTVPYFLFFNLNINKNKEFQLFKNNSILLYYATHDNKYRQTKRKTKFGQLVSGTDFEDYAINNKQIGDDNTFIEHKDGSAKFSFAFVYNDLTYGVWCDYQKGLIYVSFDYDPSSPYKFACTTKDHKPNTLLLAQAKKYNIFKTFIENYKLGNVRFENNKIKFVTQELIKNLIR